MTGQQTLFARAALGLVAGLASIVLVLWSRSRSISSRQFDRAVYGLFAATRLGLFGLTFLVLRIAPRGDVQAYYWDQAGKVLRGLLPYRDFVSSYAPLHPYLDAGLISVWHAPLAIMLFSVVVELAILPIWLTAGRAFLPEAELRVAALLYLASPLSLQFVTIDGQDNVVIATLLALAMLLVVRSRIFAAGVAFGASVAAIKFLPLLYAPAFFLAAPRRWRWAVGALAVCTVVYGGFLAAGSPIVTPLAAEGDLWSAGDIPYVAEAIFGVTVPPRLSDAVLLVALVGIFVLVGRAARQAALDARNEEQANASENAGTLRFARDDGVGGRGDGREGINGAAAQTAVRMRAITSGMAALTLALLVFSKKSWPPYVMLALFPVCLLVAGGGAVRERWKVAGFAVFSVVAVTEHSYWASSLAQFHSMEFHWALVAVERDAVLMMLLELLLIAGYLWLLWEAVSRIRTSAASTRTPALEFHDGLDS